MEREIKAFIEYIHNVKKVSHNTEEGYKRDLNKMAAFFAKQGLVDVDKVNSTNINSYILSQQKADMSTATISRSIAAIKAFFHFELSEGRISKEPTEMLKTPKNEKKLPMILSVDEVERLLAAVDGKDERAARDRAMLELLYATGMRVSEVIDLTISDVNMQMCYITCHGDGKERTIPFGDRTKQYLNKYLRTERAKIVNDDKVDLLFTNCYGGKLSRQGYWRILKDYAAKARIDKQITPHSIRHSFAAHMVQNGADIHTIQEMMGHVDISSTQIYAQLANSKIREVYAKAHPHG